ncbi:hypothetical protein BH10BAC4_BH10BAC4_25940 [soil metagenome]
MASVEYELQTINPTNDSAHFPCVQFRPTLNVAQVCYESGYSNISNFNKVFKIKTHYSPLNYRKEFR